MKTPVTSLMSQITSATGDSPVGIGQVNDAVNRLDSVTQQNANMVGQTAAEVGVLNERTTLSRAVAGLSRQRLRAVTAAPCAR